MKLIKLDELDKLDGLDERQGTVHSNEKKLKNKIKEKLRGTFEKTYLIDTTVNRSLT